MTDEELAAALAWLRCYQGLELDPALLREPAAVAGRLSALAAEAAAGLPFGAEPAGLQRVLSTLIDGGGDDAG